MELFEITKVRYRDADGGDDTEKHECDAEVNGGLMHANSLRGSACWRIARKKPMTARPKLVMARIVLIHASVVRSSAMLVRKAASFVRRSARGTRGSDGGVSVMAARGVPSGGPTVQGNLRTAAVSGRARSEI